MLECLIKGAKLKIDLGSFYNLLIHWKCNFKELLRGELDLLAWKAETVSFHLAVSDKVCILILTMYL